jgi:hypothetical protein
VRLLDLHPVRLVVARIAAHRLATVAMGFFAILLVISLSVQFIAFGPEIPSWRLLSWKLNVNPAQTTTVFMIEVEHPGCTPTDSRPWLADPIISYTPRAVTITMHMNDTPDVAKCFTQETTHEGSLPIVGSYLMGILVTVHLSEPLGGRTLFDGSMSPPVERTLR